MGKSTNRICYTCGKHYYFCGHCPEHKGAPLWQNTVCSEECNTVFTTCAQYNLGYLSKPQARKILNEYSAKDKVYKSNTINDTIKLIYQYDKKATQLTAPPANEPDIDASVSVTEADLCE